ncbi:hypothetical protein AMJ57_05150, partial [Parcubacteria bacterium SG8_24]
MATLKKFTKKQVDQLTFRIKTLDAAERKMVREAIYPLLAGGDGQIGQKELHIELMKLRETYKISD